MTKSYSDLCRCKTCRLYIAHNMAQPIRYCGEYKYINGVRCIHDGTPWDELVKRRKAEGLKRLEGYIDEHREVLIAHGTIEPDYVVVTPVDKLVAQMNREGVGSFPIFRVLKVKRVKK